MQFLEGVLICLTLWAVP